jgi:hypothetical protein
MARKLRKNAKPQIVGDWVRRPPHATGDAEQDSRLEGQLDEFKRAQRAANLDGVAFVEAELSSAPISKRKRGRVTAAVDPLDSDLVPAPTFGALDVVGFLDAMVEILNLAYDLTVGVGEGGLFNFEKVCRMARATVGRVRARLRGPSRRCWVRLDVRLKRLRLRKTPSPPLAEPNRPS